MTTKYHDTYLTGGTWSPTRPGVFFTIKDGGKLVTCGSVDGTATLLDVCDGLAVMQQNEKPSINQMFERETKREKNLEARAKELKLKAKRDAAAKEAAPEVDYTAILEEVEKEFAEMTADAGDYSE